MADNTVAPVAAPPAAATPAPSAPKAKPVANDAEATGARDNLPLPEGQEGAKPHSKEQLYRHIASRLNLKVDTYFAPVAERMLKKHNEEIKMRQVFGDQDARDLLVLFWTGMFDILLQPDGEGQYKESSVGIPAGFGSLQLTTAGATTKKTPQGQVVDVLKRWRVKYSPGKAVDSRLSQLPAPPPDEPTATPATPAAAATPTA